MYLLLLPPLQLQTSITCALSLLAEVLSNMKNWRPTSAQISSNGQFTFGGGGLNTGTKSGPQAKASQGRVGGADYTEATWNKALFVTDELLHNLPILLPAGALCETFKLVSNAEPRRCLWVLNFPIGAQSTSLWLPGKPQTPLPLHNDKFWQLLQVKIGLTPLWKLEQYNRDISKYGLNSKIEPAFLPQQQQEVRRLPSVQQADDSLADQAELAEHWRDAPFIDPLFLRSYKGHIKAGSFFETQRGLKRFLWKATQEIWPSPDLPAPWSPESKFWTRVATLSGQTPKSKWLACRASERSALAHSAVAPRAPRSSQLVIDEQDAAPPNVGECFICGSQVLSTIPGPDTERSPLREPNVSERVTPSTAPPLACGNGHEQRWNVRRSHANTLGRGQ